MLKMTSTPLIPLVIRLQSAEQLHSWITRHLPPGPKPPIHRPLNYVRIVSVTTTVLGLISFFSVAAPYILPILQNRNLWAAVSLLIILLFTSGHMFNHIRKVPYVSGDGKGGISYFAGGFSNQFGLETQIVAAICMYQAVTTTNNGMLGQTLTNGRRYSLIRHNCSCIESTPDVRSPVSANRRLCLGRFDIRHVQLPSQRFPGKKWRLSVLSTSILASVSVS